MQSGITGQQTSAVFPISGLLHERFTLRIGQQVVGDFLKGCRVAVLLSQDMIVGLLLPVVPWRHGMGAQKGDGLALGGMGAETQHEQVQMVGHEHVGRAHEMVAMTGVKQNFPELLMESLTQPTSGAVLNGEGPEDNGVPMVAPRLQARQPAMFLISHNVEATLGDWFGNGRLIWCGGA